MKQLLAALAASAALAAPAAAQDSCSYGSKIPALAGLCESDRMLEIRGIVQQEIRDQRLQSPQVHLFGPPDATSGYVPAPAPKYSPSGSCYYCDSLIK